jgi:hypothetical protein
VYAETIAPCAAFPLRKAALLQPEWGIAAASCTQKTPLQSLPRWNSISREQRGPFDLDAPLSRYEGFHILHLATDDLDQVRFRLRKSRLHPSTIRSFQRIVDTPNGSEMMRARSFYFPEGSNPEALVQIAQHETPELALEPRYMQHPNGAVSITEVIMCGNNLEAVAGKIRTLYRSISAARR